MRYIDHGSSVNLVEEMEIEQTLNKPKEKVFLSKSNIQHWNLFGIIMTITENYNTTNLHN